MGRHEDIKETPSAAERTREPSEVRREEQRKAPSAGRQVLEATKEAAHAVMDYFKDGAQAVKEKASDAPPRAEEAPQEGEDLSSKQPGEQRVERVEKMAEAAKEKGRELKGAASDIANRVADKAEDTIAAAKEKGQELKQKAGDAKDKAAEKAEGTKDSANEKGHELTQSAEEDEADDDVTTKEAKIAHRPAQHQLPTLRTTLITIGAIATAILAVYVGTTWAIHKITNKVTAKAYQKAKDVAHDKLHDTRIDAVLESPMGFFEDIGVAAKDQASEKAHEVLGRAQEYAGEAYDRVKGKADHGSKTRAGRSKKLGHHR